MAKKASMAQAGGVSDIPQLPYGSVRSCIPYHSELARHRLISADGHDYVVATARGDSEGRSFVTGAYPVTRGYLVMIRQPLCEVRTVNVEVAREQHEQLVRVLAEAGVRVVRARRSLAARQRAERAEALAERTSLASAGQLTATTSAI